MDRYLRYCAVTSRFTLTVRLVNATTFNATTGHQDVLQEAAFELKERGFYTLHFFASTQGRLQMEMGREEVADAVEAVSGMQWALLTDAKGDNAYIALFIVFPVLVVLLVLCRVLVDDRVARPVQAAYESFIAGDRTAMAVKASTRRGEEEDDTKTGSSVQSTSYQHHAAQPSLKQSLLSSSAEADGSQSAVPLQDEALVRAVDGRPGLESAASPTSSSLAPSLVRRSIKGKERLLSLDSFRGLALSVMLFVNIGGGGYWFFDHAEWDGLTVADLVFPWFIWMMGASMALSFASLEKRGVGRREATLKVLRRAALLFFLGLCVSNDGGDNLTLGHLRIMGVLQRFGLSYLIVGLVILYSPRLGPGRDDTQRGLVTGMDGVEASEASNGGESARGLPPLLSRLLPSRAAVQEYYHHSVEMGVMAVILLLHLLLTFTVSFDGCPRGYLGPGGLADGGQYWDCVGGAAGYFDRLLLGVEHIYGGPTCRDVYRCPAYDPEGLLGTLNSAVLCYLGVIAGRTLLWHKDHGERLKRWAVGMAVCGVLALILCGGSQYDGWIPVNKNLWSLSFILTMASFAFFTLSVFYCIIDVYHFWDGAPFRAMGSAQQRSIDTRASLAGGRSRAHKSSRHSS